VELRNLRAFGEPGTIVYLADCVELMKIMPPGSVDVVFADPPYRLSRGGVTVKNGRLAPVDKGAWDRSMGFAEDHQFNVRWLKEASRILKPDGTIWVTGTHHIIFSLGFALQTMRFKIINRDPFVVQTSAPTFSGSEKAPVISSERSGQSLTLSRSIL
jgi:site-specific DNA-methyltransferase (adenine-specific)